MTFFPSYQLRTAMEQSVNSRSVFPNRNQGVFMSRVMRRIGVFAVAIGLFWTTAVAEALIIDDFTQNQSVMDNAADGAGVSGNVANAGILGGNRGVYVEKTAPAGSSTDITALAENGRFNVSRDSGVSGNVLVQWDGDAVAPAAFNPESNLSFLLGADLTAGNGAGILIKIFEADTASQTLRVTLWGANNTVASELAISLPAAAPPAYDLQFPFANFTAVGGKSAANPASVGAITLAITGNTGADLTLELIGTYAVPEPATASMFGLGAAVLLSRFRRRRRTNVDRS